MFEIGFSELILVAVVALLVFGPDKLPGLARNVGLWTGRIRRMVNSVQQDVQRELAKADELTHLLEEQKNIVERHLILDDTLPTVAVTGKPAEKVPSLTVNERNQSSPPEQVVAPAQQQQAPQQQALPLAEPTASTATHENKTR